MQAIGIDIGGSGIKGAPVDLDTGELAAERFRIPTPEASTPQAVADVVAEVVEHFDLDTSIPVGVTFPAPIIHGVVPWIANLDDSWEGVAVEKLLSERLGRPTLAVNDADAAGYAEVEYGAAKGCTGTVLVTTLGTGIGTALIINEQLVPNTELGHLILPNGKEAEAYASSAVRSKKDLGWSSWAKRLQVVYSQYERLLNPDLIIVGGGVSRKSDKFLPLLDLRAPIRPAALRNTAGIVGAARLAADAS